MAPKGKGENTKKAAGNAKKAEAAAQKQAAEDVKKATGEEKKWQTGAKDNSKADAAATKAAEAARKKAEKDALLKEEEESLPTKPTGNKKAATKKSNKLDLSALDGFQPSKKEQAALNATGIDNALDALSLTSNPQDKIDRHPERRFKAAYAAFEERRLDEMKDEKGLRRQQKVEMIRKEFEKSIENPFNQGNAGQFNLNKEEMREMRESERDKKEALLVEK